MRKSFPQGYYACKAVDRDGPAIGATTDVVVIVSDYASDNDGRTFKISVKETVAGPVVTDIRESRGSTFRAVPEIKEPAVRTTLDLVVKTERMRAEQSRALPVEFDWGGHVFVQARPFGRRWSEYDGTNGISDHATVDEFRPCMLRGHDSGQRLYVIGSQYAYDPLDFEIRMGKPLKAAA